jgi:hypothetical protein
MEFFQVDIGVQLLAGAETKQGGVSVCLSESMSKLTRVGKGGST